MFVKEYELRYSDTDKNGSVKTSTVLDLLQDISIAHAESVGLGSEKFKSISVACLLAGWRVRFIKPIEISAPVTIKTGLMNITKCEANRKYEIWQKGEQKIVATALWFTVNTEKMRIARVVEELFTVFESTSEEDNNLPCAKLKPEPDLNFLGETKVEKRYLDTNNHMNNVKSVETVLNFMPDGFVISELHVKYRKELKPDETIKIYGKHTDEGICFEIKNADDQPCVLVNII